MKVSFTIIFLVATLNASLSRKCNNITPEDLKRVISERLESDVEINDYSVVCLASSGQRDKYAYASAVTNYTCIECDDAEDELECPVNSAHSVVRQITAECDTSDGSWSACIIDGRDITISCRSANFSTPPRNDCSSCLPPGGLDYALGRGLYESTTYCLGRLFIKNKINVLF